LSKKGIKESEDCKDVEKCFKEGWEAIVSEKLVLKIFKF